MSRTPIHPGEILKEELDVLGVSAAALARELLVPENRVSEIIRGRRAVTADTALRLGRWFGTSANFWLNLQKAMNCVVPRGNTVRTLIESSRARQ